MTTKKNSTDTQYTHNVTFGQIQASKEEAAAATENEGAVCEEVVDDDEDSPQRLLIGWMQARIQP